MQKIKRLMLCLIVLVVSSSFAQDATPEATASVDVNAAEPAEDVVGVYEDPEGFFSVPIPTLWTVTENEGYVTLSDPEGLLLAHVLSVEGTDIEAAVDTTLRQINPEFDLVLADANVQAPPAPAGVEEVKVITYDTGDDTSRIFQGYGQLVNGRIYLILFDVDTAAAVRRASQINIIATGFTITAVEAVDLAGVEARIIDDALIAELETFINDALPRAEIPGAAVAIVQNGEVVYSSGFGVRELGGTDPVTPETLMMIGSTTKTFTTLLLATLVDEGVITWDTPVVDILPSFKLADPEITAQITVRNLVCACSGVPRRDLEIIMNYDELTPGDVVESLGTFEFFTDFGEAFQYSNQLVAMGGYAGAIAAGAELDNLNEAYMREIDTRILQPLQMTGSTFSFEEAAANDNHAVPHGANLDGSYYPIPLSYEEFSLPIAPAGALWSNVLDMSRYLQMEMAVGVTPDGTRIVSEENLQVTWQPQIELAAGESYGLGWFVGEYKGLQLLSHGGNMIGFTSDFAFLPEANLGIVVLTNARGSNFFNEAVRTRLFELVFDQEAESVQGFDFIIQQAEEAVGEQNFSDQIDAEAVEPLVGTFSNPELGTLTITFEEGVLSADAGEFQSELRANINEDTDEVESYVLYGAPLTGLPLEFRTGEDGNPTLVIDAVTSEYVFTKVE